MATFRIYQTNKIGNMAIFGTVFSVDTATLIVKVEELDKLRKLQVNHLVAIKSSKAGQYLIGIINRITRKATDDEQPVGEDLGLNNFLFTENILKVNLKIGYLIGVKQRKRDTKYLPYMLREIIESKELYL
mgnify:CR=1 FL=1